MTDMLSPFALTEISLDSVESMRRAIDRISEADARGFAGVIPVR